MNTYIYNKIYDNYYNKNIKIYGIHGPKGIGKTTLCKFLENDFYYKHNIKVLTLSLDDFFLDYVNMIKFLIKSNDKLYSFRGLAGTHDTNLLYEVIIDLLNGKKTLIPNFDNKLFNGFGDRYNFKNINYKPDIILIEGCILGYSYKEDINSDLYLFNEKLKEYSKIKDVIEHWFYLDTDNIKNIYIWNRNIYNNKKKNEFNYLISPYITIYRHYQLHLKNNIIIDFNRNIKNYDI
tara:strand:- start:505 stop:1209 length:705 start_codon:yes stop_codon:yes gene_type:complete